MNELSWSWIVLMATAPPLIGVLVAFPIWRTKEIVLGNSAGTVVIFAVAVALMLREFVELDGLTKDYRKHWTNRFAGSFSHRPTPWLA